MKIILKYFKERTNFKNSYTVLSATLITGLGLLLYGINETVTYVDTIINPRVLLRKRNTEYIYINQAGLKNEQTDSSDIYFDIQIDDWMSPILHWWEKRKKLFIWRLVEIANTSDHDRKRAVETLASYKNLYDHECQQLAQICSQQTAVALARIRNIDKRFFLKPYRRQCFQNNQDLVMSMKNILFTLCKTSRHACLNYFLSKVFPKFPHSQAWNFLSDLDSYSYIGSPPSSVSDETILPLCIEALVHHCAVCGNQKAIVEAGALPVLLECYKQCSFEPETCHNISKIIIELSTHPEFLIDLFQTGWITILAEWVNMSDNRLSIAAASTLANLDRSSPRPGRYEREVLLLHPPHSSKEQVTTDVVLIHGLLGGVHYTWKQRGSNKEPLSIFAFTNPEAPKIDCATTASFVIDEAPHDFNMSNIENEDSLVDSDYVFVMTDIPVSESVGCNTCCSFDGNDKDQLGCLQNSEFTNCWPKDWLPKDCKNLRVVGVNYETRLTDWKHWCPLRDRGSKRILSERCKTLVKQLSHCGIGDRPVVWIAHSMGGLMLKHMLIQAWKSSESELKKICNNTKAIVFLSTPHIGSPMASLNEAWRMFFLPSTELDELRYRSPVLQALHEDFLKFVENHPIEIVSFIETENMKISTLDWEFLCVPPDTADTGTGSLYKIPLGHLDICKPDGKFSFIYQRILSLVRSVANPSSDKLGEE